MPQCILVMESLGWLVVRSEKKEAVLGKDMGMLQREGLTIELNEGSL